MKSSKRKREPMSTPELPAARPMPGEASPGGIEGADSGWAGGASNTGEVLNPQPEGKTTYSTSDMPDVARRESVRAFVCDHCGETFESESMLNVHRRTAHRPRA